jgi:hypothetical protein
MLQAERKTVRKAHGDMNNHTDAKSVANAIELKDFLNESITGNYKPGIDQAIPGADSNSTCPGEARFVDTCSYNVTV